LCRRPSPASVRRSSSMKSPLRLALALPLPVAGLVRAQPAPPPPPALIQNGSDPGTTPSGFRIYDNQALPDDIEVIKDVAYGHGGAKVLRLNIVRQKQPDGAPRPVILYIPGGGWLTADKDVALGRLAALAQRGYLGASIEFRTVREGVMPAQVEDCKCAVRFLRAHAAAYHLDPDRIGVWGASAGGHLAALLGLTADDATLEGSGGWPEFSSRVQAVSAWYAPSDFRDKDFPPDHPAARLIGGNPRGLPEQAARASPVARVNPHGAPFFLVHGARDPGVPVAESRALAAALQQAGVEVTLLVVPDAGHGFITSAEAEQMLAFFDRHLK